MAHVVRFKKRLGRCEYHAPVRRRSDEAADGIANRFIIIHNADERSCRMTHHPSIGMHHDRIISPAEGVTLIRAVAQSYVGIGSLLPSSRSSPAGASNNE